jgi:hypothetical protein
MAYDEGCHQQIGLASLSSAAAASWLSFSSIYQSTGIDLGVHSAPDRVYAAGDYTTYLSGRRSQSTQAGPSDDGRP